MIKHESPLSLKNSAIVHPVYGAKYCKGAGSEAVELTIIVLLILFNDFNLKYNWAIAEHFWPILT